MALVTVPVDRSETWGGPGCPFSRSRITSRWSSVLAICPTMSKPARFKALASVLGAMALNESCA